MTQRVTRVQVVITVALLLGATTVTGTGIVSDRGKLGQTTIEHQNGTTNQLTPQDTTQLRAEEIHIRKDVSDSAAVTAQIIHSEYEKNYIRLGGVVNDSINESRVVQKIKHIANRYEKIDTKTQKLLSEYYTGRLSGRKLLTHLLLVQKQAESLSNVKNSIENRDNVADEIKERADSLEESVIVEQPALRLVDGVITGNLSSIDLYMVSGNSSLILSSVNNNSYFRQATLYSGRNLTAPDQFRNTTFWGAGNAYDYLIGQDFYPWALAEGNLESITVGRDETSVYSQIYKFEILHSQGKITTYFDGGTKNIFHEAQRKPINEQPVTARRVNGTSDIIAAVNKTVPSGPMQISVTDTSGKPIPGATVRISGALINGTITSMTDPHGSVHTIQPYGRFTVKIITPEGHKASLSSL
ncbi:hypothetical protein GRX03_03470 [Halovenus sp. WSH3]|uniref:Uncharacterized protein n=1 Tax=Halovenus carboxidivorans TaxID=2692199 RepID=A0A6B0TBT9_9EURY|nr:carboxypeptidase-like regulatory domain-containing protein [Halovenus carboxidivorans]MXR50669.1 hypothetical protein [Halovenus carboxidivorans]